MIFSYTDPPRVRWGRWGFAPARSPGSSPPPPPRAQASYFWKKRKRIALGVHIREKTVIESMHFVFACISEAQKTDSPMGGVPYETFV